MLEKIESELADEKIGGIVATEAFGRYLPACGAP
jgi:hypothetical protein